MKFKKLKLYTNTLLKEYEFYSRILGFDVIENSDSSFTVRVGWSELTFEKSVKEYKYHYCFLIPSNKLQEALLWMEERVDVLKLDGSKIHNFKSWNADSFYFYDGSNNLAEFIARYDLSYFENSAFGISQVLGINEIGIPTRNIQSKNKQLETEIKTKFWKGDQKKFGTNGTQEGLFLLPNFQEKATWFPTLTRIELSPFEAIVDNDNKLYHIKYSNGNLKTTGL